MIDLLDSDDEDDDQDMKPAAEKQAPVPAPTSRARSGSQQSHGMSNAGRAALLRFESSKNGDTGASAAAAGAMSSLTNPTASWQCHRCTLINKPSALQCICGTERHANAAPKPMPTQNIGPTDQAVAPMIGPGALSAALFGAMADSKSASIGAVFWQRWLERGARPCWQLEEQARVPTQQW